MSDSNTSVKSKTSNSVKSAPVIKDNMKCGPINVRVAVWDGGDASLSFQLDMGLIQTFDLAENRRTFAQKRFYEFGEFDVSKEDVEKMIAFLTEFNGALKIGNLPAKK